MVQGEGYGGEPSSDEMRASKVRMSRRRFIGISAATLAGASAAVTVSQNFLDEVSQLPEPQSVNAAVSPPKRESINIEDSQEKTTEEIEQVIEAEFGILLKRTAIYKKISDRKMTEVQEEKETPWKKDQLIMLWKFLRKYPKSFLSPNEEDGTKMHIILLEKPSNNSGKAYTRTDLSNELLGKDHANLTNTISMSVDVFDSEKPEQAWFILSHELVHKIEPVTVIHGEGKVGAISYETIKASSAWQPKLKEAFDADEFSTRIVLNAKVLMKYPEILSSDQDALMQPDLWAKGNDAFTQDEHISFFARRMLYSVGLSKDGEELGRGVGDINYYPSEFYSVLSETYVFGYDHFKKMYGQYFESDVVDRLYAFTKDTIFEGRQYRRNGEEIEYFDKNTG